MLNWGSEPRGRKWRLQLQDMLLNLLSFCRQGVLNWVAELAAGRPPPRVELRLYDVLFTGEDPAGVEDWLADLSPASLEVVTDALASPPLMAARPGDRCGAATCRVHSRFRARPLQLPAAGRARMRGPNVNTSITALQARSTEFACFRASQ